MPGNTGEQGYEYLGSFRIPHTAESDDFESDLVPRDQRPFDQLCPGWFRTPGPRHRERRRPIMLTAALIVISVLAALAYGLLQITEDEHAPERGEPTVSNSHARTNPDDPASTRTGPHP